MAQNIFKDWLDSEYITAETKLKHNESLDQNDKMAVMLKYQSNHVMHLEQDVDRRFDEVEAKIDTLNTKIDNVAAGLNTKIDNLTRKILGGMALLIGIFTFVSKYI